MKKTTGQKLNMYRAVLEICKAYEAEWAGTAGFVEAVDNLEAAIAVLDAKAQLQAVKTIGVMASKMEKLDAVMERLSVLHGALEVHGATIGDNELRSRNKITLSGLKRMSGARLNIHFNQILEDINGFGTALAPYGISAEFVTESLSSIEEARNSISRPRMAIIERKMYTYSLEVQTAIIDEIIKLRLDKMMRLFKKELPEFFALYFNARNVIDVRHKRPDTSDPTDG